MLTNDSAFLLVVLTFGTVVDTTKTKSREFLTSFTLLNHTKAYTGGRSGYVRFKTSREGAISPVVSRRQKSGGRASPI